MKTRFSTVQASGRVFAVLALAFQFQLCFCLDAGAIELASGTTSEHGTSCHVDLDENAGVEQESNESKCCCESSESFIHVAKAVPTSPSVSWNIQDNDVIFSLTSLTEVVDVTSSKSVISTDPPLARQSAPFLSLRI